jgi:hypothetical protein
MEETSWEGAQKIESLRGGIVPKTGLKQVSFPSFQHPKIVSSGAARLLRKKPSIAGQGPLSAPSFHFL